VSPRRWTRNIRAWVYLYLVARDGEQCAICHATPTPKKHDPLRTNPVVTPTTQKHNTSRANSNKVSTTQNASTAQNQNALRTTPIVGSTTQTTISTTQNENKLRTTPIVSSTAQRPPAPRTNRPSQTSSTTQNQNDLRTTPIVSSTTQNTLDIDHIDGNPKNNEPDNLRLLCRRCNVATSNRSNPRRSLSSDLCVCMCVSESERERREGRLATGTARDEADYRKASPETQANLTCEPPFRRWIMATISTNGFYDRTTAMNEGAEVVGCSPATTARYLAKLTSASGPLTEIKDALGYSVLIFKPHLIKPDDT
jgi:hypothetical protein